MTTNNGSSGSSSVAKRERATKNLQIALQGESPEHINRVLSLIIKFDIDPDEEFFLIIAAIGHLKVLVEDAPKEWQHLFELFSGELDQWATTNVDHLRLLVEKTETIERLALSCEKLGNTLELLQVVSQEQTSQLKNSISLSIELREVRQELREMREFKQELKDQIFTLRKEIIPVVKNLNENKVLKWGYRWGSWLLATFGIVTGLIFWSLREMNSAISQTQLRTSWTNTKLERIEKKFGTAPRRQ